MAIIHRMHTVPISIHAWLFSRGSFRDGVMEVIRCGGDTDTTAAITGGLLGATSAKGPSRANGSTGSSNGPHGIKWMRRLGTNLAASRASSERCSLPTVSFLGVIPRNVMFLTIVLAHGFRRLLPPY
jgi:hypothetical protein